MVCHGESMVYCGYTLYCVRRQTMTFGHKPFIPEYILLGTSQPTPHFQSRRPVVRITAMFPDGRLSVCCHMARVDGRKTTSRQAHAKPSAVADNWREQWSSAPTSGSLIGTLIDWRPAPSVWKTSMTRDDDEAAVRTRLR